MPLFVPFQDKLDLQKYFWWDFRMFVYDPSPGSLVTFKVQNKETKGILIVLTSGTMPPYLSSTPLFETIKTENNKKSQGYIVLFL